jgi:hypothetical protein
MPNEQHQKERSQSRGKSRGKSQERRSKSSGRGGRSGADLRTTTTTTTQVGPRSKSRGRGGGGGEQHHQTHKTLSLEEKQSALDKEKAQAEEHRQQQIVYNNAINEEYEVSLRQQLSSEELKNYDLKKKELDDKWEVASQKAQNMTPKQQKRFTRLWKQHLRKELNAWFKSQDILIAVSKKDIAQDYHANRKEKQANQLALPAPHAHAHAHDHAPAARAQRLTDIDNLPPEAQFSYDNKELWGAPPHTRRYL